MEINKNTIGQLFFALSILMMVYMLISPLTQVIGNIDEYFTLTIINFPISDLLLISRGDTYPPLYYLLAKGIYKLSLILGLSNLSFYLLKILSIIPYALILIISATKIRKEYNWLTAGLFTFSISIMSEYFTYFLFLRPHSWALLFVVLSFIYFKDVLGTFDKKSLILFTVFSVLGSYCHYYVLISSIVLYLILLFEVLHFNKDKIKYFIFSAFGAILLYSPWIPSLINFLSSIHKSFWIPNLTIDTVIQTIGYFTYIGDNLLSLIALLILITITIVYLKETKDDKFYVLSGIGVYFGTILLSILISITFKPILLERCLLPASAVLWLVISIMVAKIQNKKRFLISIAIIILLLLSGIGNMIATSDSTYQSGIAQKESINQILEDNNSSVLLLQPRSIMYFLSYSNHTDMYCLNLDYLYGENMNKTHQIFDFKDITDSDFDNLENNTNKNLYIISLGKPDSNFKTTQILNEDNLIISKVNTTN